MVNACAYEAELAAMRAMVASLILTKWGETLSRRELSKEGVRMVQAFILALVLYRPPG